MEEETLKLDTAIIEGGITGLYTCLQLWKQNGPGHRIALFKHYWQSFVAEEPHLRVELNNDSRLCEYYVKYLSHAPHPAFRPHGEGGRDALTCFGIRDFSREPFEAGVHFWKPGVEIENAITELSAFPFLRTGRSHNCLHICGEAYSDFQGFIEGGLRTALGVVQRIGGIRGITNSKVEPRNEKR